MQDCLERAWSRAHLWRQGNIRGWLFTIMHNVSVNTRRRENRSPRLTSIEAAGIEPATRPLQEDGLSLAVLNNALAALPHEQRNVILLVGLEQFSYGETAEILQVPIGTVMSRLHRGRERLRQLLATEDSLDVRAAK